tara:strand:- start:4230 stop:4796 length:567 start_codon:yes stop_codon:yes gene_type:complete
MKYLLALLFLFSNYCFSKDADNKGLDCNVEITESSNKLKKDIGQKKRIILWFNNGKVTQARISQLMLEMGYGIEGLPKDKSLNDFKYEDNNYLANPDFLTWKRELKFGDIAWINEWKVNRKTLILSHSYASTDYKEWKNNMTEEQKMKLIHKSFRTGQCTVFTDFKVVEKYLEEKKIEIKKSMEENKI